MRQYARQALSPLLSPTMFARCTICLDGLGERNPPLSTICGHLYCARCAGRYFVHRAPCATCRRGPFMLNQLVKLFPNYDNASDTASLQSPSCDGAPAATPAQRRNASAGASRRSGVESLALSIVQTIAARAANLLVSPGRHGHQSPSPPSTAIPATPPRRARLRRPRSTSNADTQAIQHVRHDTTTSWVVPRPATPGPIRRRESSVPPEWETNSEESTSVPMRGVVGANR